MICCSPNASLTRPIIDGRKATDDFTAFNEVWDKPDGGMHKYLYRFLTSSDQTFQHIAVWTIVQLLESGGAHFSRILHFAGHDRTLADPQLLSNIRGSNILIPNIRQLASSRSASATSSMGTPRSHRSPTRSYQETDTGDGRAEIQLLGRRIVEFIDGEVDILGPSSVTHSHMPGSSVDESIVSGRDHEELRKSVREALSAHGH